MPKPPSLLSLTSLILKGSRADVDAALMRTTRPLGQVAVISAIERDDPGILKLVLARTALDWDGFTIRAAKEGRLQALSVLLTRPTPDVTGQKALRAAAKADRWDAFSMLLEHTDSSFVLATCDDRNQVVQSAPAAVMTALLAHPHEATDVRNALDMALAFGLGKRLEMARVLAPHVPMGSDVGLLRRAAQSSDAMLDLIFPRCQPSTALDLAMDFLKEESWWPLDKLAARMPTHNQRALIFGHGAKLPVTHALVVQHDLAHGRAARAQDLGDDVQPRRGRHRP